VEGPLFLLVAKLLDWPTILAGICAGLLAWSRVGAAGMTLIAAVIAEVILTQVRGWPIRPYWIAIGVVAALPWAVLGFVLRSVILALVRKARPGA